MKKTEEIILCPTCKGYEQIRYYDRKPRSCGVCNGKGRVWQITNIYIERIDKLHPKRLQYKGL